MNQDIGFEIHVDLPYDKAVEKVIETLKQEGFGVLTRIDVKATLKEKLDKDFRPYIIMGACNPRLAHRALSNNAEVGLMLPCNVTVEADPQGGSIVRIVNPEVMMSVGTLKDNDKLVEVASEARILLERVAGALL